MRIEYASVQILEQVNRVALRSAKFEVLQQQDDPYGFRNTRGEYPPSLFRTIRQIRIQFVINRGAVRRSLGQGSIAPGGAGSVFRSSPSLPRVLAAHPLEQLKKLSVKLFGIEALQDQSPSALSHGNCGFSVLGHLAQSQRESCRISLRD